MADAYYFGCDGPPGHFFHTPARHQTYNVPRWMERLDGVLPPRDDREAQGPATLTYMHGWTAIAWWDRSVDKRGACNSVVWLRGELSWDEALAAARRAFPWVFARLGYEVTLAGAPPAAERHHG